MAKQSLLKGTLILTIAMTICKVLGFIYVVPFTAIVGTEGYILFEYAYKPYAIMLSIATLGIPLAVSKYVAKYNELGQTEKNNALLKRGTTIMVITGTIGFLLLYFGSHYIATVLVGGNDKSGNSIEDVVLVVKCVSFAMIVTPMMGIWRGFFQGHGSMMPTAVSQVVEQILRIILILVGAMIVLSHNPDHISVAVGVATLGALVGTFGSIGVLLWYFKRDGMYASLTTRTKHDEGMFREILSYALPFVLINLGIPILQTLDTFMVNDGLRAVGYTLHKAEMINGMLSLNQKVILIPVSLATAYGLTLVPTITASYTKGDKALMNTQIQQTLRVVLILTLPSVAGMMLLSDSIYTVLFGMGGHKLGGSILWSNSVTALIFSLYIVVTSILQGMNKQKVVVITLVIGLIIKGVLNYPFIQKFHEDGTVLSTLCGLGVSILMNAWIIKKETGYSVRQDTVVMGKLFVALILMIVSVMGIDGMLASEMTANNYNKYLIRLMIGVGVGVLMFGGMAQSLGLVKLILGREISLKRLMKKVLRK